MKHKLFKRYLISYFVFVLIILVIGIFSYDKSLNIIESGLIENEMKELENGISQLEMRINEIDKTFYVLSESREIMEVQRINSLDEQKTITKLMDAKNFVGKISSSNNFYEQIYVYYRNSDLMISNNYIVTDIENFYKNFIYDDTVSLDEWKTQMFFNRHTNKFFSARRIENYYQNTSKDMVIYVSSDKDSLIEPNFDTYFVFIDIMTICNVMGLDINTDSRFEVFDKESRELILDLNIDTLQNSNDEIINNSVVEIDGVKYLRVVKESMRLNLEFVKDVPYIKIANQLKSIRFYLISVLILALIASIILAYYFTNRNAEPIIDFSKQISKVLKTNIKNNQGEFDYLKDSMMKLCDERNELINNIDKQKEQMKYMFLESLLNGDFYIKDNVKYLNQIEKDLTGSTHFIVICAKVYVENDTHENGYSKLDMIIPMLMKMIERKLPYKIIAHRTSVDVFSIIIGLTNADIIMYKGKIDEVLQDIQKDQANINGTNINFVVGGICDDLIKISQSYYEAMQLRGFSELEQINWYDNSELNDYYLFYPLEVELKLINQIKSGDCDKVINTLDNLYDNNKKRCQYSKLVMLQFVYQLRGTLLKVIQNLDSSEENFLKLVHETYNSETSKETFIDLRKIFISVVEYYNDKSQTHHEHMMEEITKYIEDNYEDVNLSVTSIAQMVGLTEKYISMLYFKSKGISISEAVESYRLKKAAEILIKSSESIVSICKKIGYQNYNTFYKAFKRKFGTSPGDFRKKS